MNQSSSVDREPTPAAEVSAEKTPGKEEEGILSAKVFTLHELPELLNKVEEGTKTQNRADSERFYRWLKEVTANGDSFTIQTNEGMKSIHISQMRQVNPEVAALLRGEPIEETETHAAEAIPETPAEEEKISAEEIDNAPTQPENATKSQETEEADFQQALEKAETIDDIAAAMHAEAEKNNGRFRMNMSRQHLPPETVEAMIRGENGYNQNMINDSRLQSAVTRVLEKISEERTKEETPKESEVAPTTKQHETEEPTNPEASVSTPATQQEQEKPIIENNISTEPDSEEATGNKLPEHGVVAAQAAQVTAELAKVGVRMAHTTEEKAVERTPSNGSIGKAPEEEKPTGSEQLPADAAVPQEERRLSYSEQLEAFFKKRKEDLMEAASPDDLIKIINSNPFANDLFSSGNRMYEIPGKNGTRATEVPVRDMVRNIRALAVYAQENGFNENTRDGMVRAALESIGEDPDVKDALVRVLKNQKRSSV